MEEIKSERLIIRKFKEDDWKDLYEYLSDEEVVKFEPYDVFSEEKCKEEVINRSISEAFFAVCLKENNKVIGNLYFEKQDFDTFEIGYVFNLRYQKKGYATESAKAIIDYTFKNCSGRRIIAMCNPKNENSWKLLERLNMRREGHLKENIFFFKDESGNPIWQDTYEYGILKSEWINYEK